MYLLQIKHFTNAFYCQTKTEVVNFKAKAMFNLQHWVK